MARSNRYRTASASAGDTQINTRLPDGVLAALDAWIAGQDEPRPSRPEAVRVALVDWLVRQGLMRFEDRLDESSF